MQLEIKRQTAVSWLDVYYAERSVGLFDQLDRQIELQAIHRVDLDFVPSASTP